MDGLPVMAVTGTSKGIGQGIAEYFAGRGYQVAGCSRGPSTLDIENYQHTQVDVGDEKQVRSWVRAIKKVYQHIDVLVCNAGFMPGGLLMTMTSSDVLDVILRTNVNGTYYMCREVAKLMMFQKYGRIITVSSIMASVHAEGTSAYSASKSAVVEMTKVLAKELAATGITCNVIAPSLVLTEAAQALGKDVIARVLEKQTIKRDLTISEICNAIAFFMAPESGCITGQVLYMGLVN
jgi:3-oxoacyl-[acyl-carrier protein] reductase